MYLSFKEFIRKVWNPKNFKGHVSPTELMFAISKASNGRFRCGADLLSSQQLPDKKTATQQQLSTSLTSADASSSTDPVQFFAWLCSTLNLEFRRQFAPENKTVKTPESRA